MNRTGIPAKKAREIALRALVRVEQDDAYLNLVLPSLASGACPEERALAVQLAKGTVQRLNTLDWALGQFLNRSINTLTPWVRNLLRLGAYQILYLDRIPDYAAVDQSVSLARRFGHRGVAGLVNAVLRRLNQNAAYLSWPDIKKRPLEYLSLKYSYPEWLVSRAINRFGLQEAENWCRANNKMPPTAIRPNSLRTDRAGLIEKMCLEGFEVTPSPLVPGMLRLNTAGSPVAADAFKKGLFTVQGESSALVAPMLNVRPGETVVDLCSAPGGKTTHLAETMKDRGLIYAVDINKNRMQLVKKTARRLGLTSIKSVLADGRDLDRNKLIPPDAVLVDAPCSGLGVIRRLPEIKWRRSEKELQGRQNLQLELLNSAAFLLKAGGHLLYSVCSNEPEETVQVFELFNRLHPEFSAKPLYSLLPEGLQENQADQPAVSLLPHDHDLDGFFIALWEKKN